MIVLNVRLTKSKVVVQGREVEGYYKGKWVKRDGSVKISDVTVAKAVRPEINNTLKTYEDYMDTEIRIAETDEEEEKANGFFSNQKKQTADGKWKTIKDDNGKIYQKLVITENWKQTDNLPYDIVFPKVTNEDMY